MRTDPEYWEQVQHLVPEFIEANYEPCEGWKCGVIARVAVKKFHDFVVENFKMEASTISYHTFYQELRRLGYDIPVVKSYDQNTRIKGITRRDV